MFRTRPSDSLSLVPAANEAEELDSGEGNAGEGPQDERELVAIVDPDLCLVRQRIAPLFAPYARICQARCLDEVYELCRNEHHIALALVELDLPGEASCGSWAGHPGFEALELLCAQYPTAYVSVLSRHIRTDYVNRAQYLGAKYISKLGGYENLRALAKAFGKQAA